MRTFVVSININLYYLLSRNFVCIYSYIYYKIIYIFILLPLTEYTTI